MGSKLSQPDRKIDLFLGGMMHSTGEDWRPYPRSWER